MIIINNYNYIWVRIYLSSVYGGFESPNPHPLARHCLILKIFLFIAKSILVAFYDGYELLWVSIFWSSPLQRYTEFSKNIGYKQKVMENQICNKTFSIKKKKKKVDFLKQNAIHLKYVIFQDQCKYFHFFMFC